MGLTRIEGVHSFHRTPSNQDLQGKHELRRLKLKSLKDSTSPTPKAYVVQPPLFRLNMNVLNRGGYAVVLRCDVYFYTTCYLHIIQHVYGVKHSKTIDKQVRDR